MKITHIALQVRDIEASIRFYQRFCGMSIVHDRTDDFRVAWMGYGEDPPQFVIVLLHKDYPRNDQPALSHIGVAVDSREQVERLYESAVAEGCPGRWPPTDGGPVVGYFSAVEDPDGNLVEFSFGQRIGVGEK